MAAQPSTSTDTWTRADLDRFPDDGNRYEIVDGHLLVSPGPRIAHQVMVARLLRALMQWADDHGGLALPGANVDLANDTHLEPDVLWTSDTDTSAVGYKVTPELIIEVASRSTKRYDAGIKRDRYARAGVREYWIVDIDHAEVHRTVVTDRRLADPEVLGHGDTLTTALLPGLSIDLDQLFTLDV